MSTTCSPISYFCGSLGVSAAIALANLGAAYATAKSGSGIWAMGVMKADLVMRSLIPVVMGGVLGIYGLIAAVIINGKHEKPFTLSLFSGSAMLSAGLIVGFSSLAAGYAIGVVGDVGVRLNALCNGKLFVGMILILIFSEAIALYGLIVALVVVNGVTEKANDICLPFKI